MFWPQHGLEFKGFGASFGRRFGMSVVKKRVRPEFGSGFPAWDPKVLGFEAVV